jgi:cytochrome c oxidase subunit II
MKRFALLLMPLPCVFAASCGGNDFQSALHPASDEARAIGWLWWLMVIIYGLVFVITLGLAVAALRRGDEKQDRQAPGGPVKFVVISGIVVPAVILLAMLFFSLRTGSALRAPETEHTIEITGRLWWWDVRYAESGVVTANEIRIPAGSPVRLDLTSADVIHSFWVPNLHGKMDLVPGHINRFWIRADRPANYRGICAEFCGTQHALMGIDVIVMPPDEFDAWIAERAEPPAPPESRGRALFFETGCAACHSIRGTEAIATVGPDLTHLASRRTLAASTLPNDTENLARWLVDPQSIKPGNLMPPTHLRSEELEKLVAFLQTLR